MTIIHIVQDTGNAQGNLILQGVYGTQEPSAQEGGSGQFRIAPEFRQISYLFGLLEEGSAPVMVGQTRTIEVDDQLADTVRSQLMLGLARRWAGLFKSVSPEVPGMLQTMIQSESRQVSDAVRNHLVARGMRAWLVPVAATAELAIAGSDLAPGPADRSLVQAIQQSARLSAIAFDPNHSPLDLGAEMFGQSLARPAAGEHPEPAGADTQEAEPAWRHFQGIRASIKGGIIVAARDAQEAVAAANWVLQSGEPNARSEVYVEQVRSTEDMGLDLSDEDWSDDNDRYSDRG